MHYATYTTYSLCQGSVDLRLFSHKVPRTLRAHLNIVLNCAYFLSEFIYVYMITYPFNPVDPYACKPILFVLQVFTPVRMHYVRSYFGAEFY
jgi:hypothetical protein